MIKNLGQSTYQMFHKKDLLWGNPSKGEMAIAMKTQEGRVILDTNDEVMADVFSKINYFTASGNFINIDMIERIQRTYVGVALYYGVTFIGVNVTDNILLTTEEFEKLKDKLTVL